MSRTQVLRGIKLLAVAIERGIGQREEVSLLRDTIDATAVTSFPPDFVDPGCAKYLGRRMRLRFITGWCEGTVQQQLPKRKVVTYDVRFDGELGPREFKPRLETYDARSAAPQGSWYLSTSSEPLGA
eukprot:8003-Heterococcus_DN1.PRE.2